MLTVRRCSFSVGFSTLLALSLPQSTKLSELTVENLNLTDIHFCMCFVKMEVYFALTWMVSPVNGAECCGIRSTKPILCRLVARGIDGSGCIPLLPLVYALKAPLMAPTPILIGLLAWKDSFTNCRHKRVVQNLEL
jgi:hypothetical protein